MRDKLEETKFPCIFRRSKDKRLFVRVRLVNERTGTQMEMSRLLAKRGTVEDAQRLVAELHLQVRNPIPPKPKPPSFLDYAAEWIADKLLRGEWTKDASTLSTVEGQIRNHIAPMFGDYLIDKITEQDLKAWMSDQIRSGAAKSSIRTRWITLKNILRDACRQHKLEDPTVGVKLPKGASIPDNRDESLVVEGDVLRKLLLHALAASPDLWHPLLMLGFSTGARPSELVAVRAGDLRLDGDIGIWDVAVHRVRKKVLPGTKQHAKGRKNVRIDQHTTALLRPLWQRRLRDGGAGAWLFPAAGRAKRSGRSITAAALHRFLVVAHENGIIPKLSAKTCRQTHVTLAGLAGISEKMVMLNVGHNSPQVHDLYNRPSEQPRQDAARRFGDVLHGDAHLQKVGTKLGTKLGTDACSLEID